MTVNMDINLITGNDVHWYAILQGWLHKHADSDYISLYMHMGPRCML